MKLVIVYICIIIALLVYLVFGYNGIVKYSEMAHMERSYDAELERMEKKLTYLNREIEMLKTDNAYLEYVIRRELGMQKHDEDQYIIINYNATISSK